jgi:endoglucanase
LYAQVGNYTVEKTLWDRPEAYTNKTARRPTYYVTTKNGTSDLAGQMIAAFASTALVFQDRDPAYAEKLMDAALKLYGPAVRYRGRYTKNFIYKCAPEVHLGPVPFSAPSISCNVHACFSSYCLSFLALFAPP